MGWGGQGGKPIEEKSSRKTSSLGKQNQKGGTFFREVS